MRLATITAFLGTLAMTIVLIYGFTSGDFSSDGAALMQNPWGIVSLVDLYTGFTLFSGWIIFREKSAARSAVWVLLMMVLGFFAGSVYTLMALNRSKGDWTRFWMGKRADG